MLRGLVGTNNLQRILLFLFVNGKCYGTQLQRALQTPLTPVQKALIRLQRGNIIVSHTEGKTRLYEFNPAYPLLPELEQLLKKAYTLLPAHEKRGLHALHDKHAHQGVSEVNALHVLESFWQKLGTVRQLTFSAKTRSTEPTGWQGKGKGEVTSIKEGDSTLIFHEKGSWQGKQGEVTFSNVFRWTINKEEGLISLEHLRRGPEAPVFLFNLAPSGKYSLASVDSHLCDGDAYFGHIQFDHYSLRLHWRVIGPKKNEEIDYYYN